MTAGSPWIGSAALGLYGMTGRLIRPALGVFLSRRVQRGKEDASRIHERFGEARLGRPAGALVWVHAASVGETNSILPLVELLCERGLSVLLTTVTVTSAGIAARRLPSGAVHQFVPLDVPSAVIPFLNHWRPDLALFAESELWPTAMRELRRRRVPLVLVNARMSERSYRGWKRFQPLARAMLRLTDRSLAQSTRDAGRLKALGAPHVRTTGNLKFDVPPPPVDAESLAALSRQTAGRRILFAASTHPGEEAILGEIHVRLAPRFPGLLTVIAPRHPERGPALADELAASLAPDGTACVLRSREPEIVRGTGIYIADTVGEMGLWYRLADLAFIGGSLVPHGGQNPIEAAKLGVAILHGPHTGNFVDIYREFDGSGASLLIDGAGELESRVAELLADAAQREAQVSNARACIEGLSGALERTVAELAPYLDDLTPDPRKNLAARA
ncbi:3-deoxy-D-manno-octulosonic-acid transferase [Faunimonas pinastri]|uniref:3-deoxy-D-manno-octulosonic acid transferase n=1 Tax=Faunimonas pinastri TaxID=1855383 RepID=A0A1H8ZMB2_9HYPH|nr:3-deoxy-D-manno-octulosonic acid transferase [Faunimonas pinastri]SEP65411.1 3-deoxy-D-manno-octulosonic-acid transferase [Faunimonas pinastri]